MLFVACELWLEFPDGLFELSRYDDGVCVAPHVLDEFAVDLGEFPAVSEDVVGVDLLFVAVGEEELGQRRAVAEALQDAVHETCVAEVAKADCADCLRRACDVIVFQVVRGGVRGGVGRGVGGRGGFGVARVVVV